MYISMYIYIYMHINICVYIYICMYKCFCLFISYRCFCFCLRCPRVQGLAGFLLSEKRFGEVLRFSDLQVVGCRDLFFSLAL